MFSQDVTFTEDSCPAALFWQWLTWGVTSFPSSEPFWFYFGGTAVVEKSEYHT